MDEYTRKSASSRLVVPRKGSTGLVLKDPNDHKDRNAKYCNRIGCSGRLNSLKETQIISSEKLNSSKSSLRRNGKEVIGSSSTSCSAVTNPRKSCHGPLKKVASRIEVDTSETSSLQDEPGTSEAGSSSLSSPPRPHKRPHQNSVMGNREATSLTTRSSYRGAQNGLRNMGCNSIANVIPPGASRGKDTSVRKRNPEVESSSTTFRGKSNSTYSHGISISESRRTRSSWLPSGSRESGGVTSVSTRRLGNGNTKMRISSDQGSGNRLLPNGSRVGARAEGPMGVNAPYSTSHRSSKEASSSRARPYGRPGSSSDNSCRLVSSSEVEINRPLMNRESFRRYNIDGVAEVLLALERIEHEEELTLEQQMLVLETNLLLGGLVFQDQHRGMRLDIDNMSYEELLALEEKMGTVSTALPEEALVKCLERSSYVAAAPEAKSKEDIKCSICQEEYVAGDEVGRLGCEHQYHVACVKQWLGFKNWCPICKAPAVPSSSPSS